MSLTDELLGGREEDLYLLCGDQGTEKASGKRAVRFIEQQGAPSGAGRVRVVWDDGRWSDIKGMVYEPTLPSQSTSKDE